MLDRKRDGSVGGVICYGGQLVLATTDAATLDAFGVQTRGYPGMRSFVGPKFAVDGLWSRVKNWHRLPTLVRGCQPLYVVGPQTLAQTPAVPVRLARPDETEIVAEHSARMILGELGYDPRSHRASFNAGVRRAIERELWWVWIDDGELRFQCNVGIRTPLTAQIQGVWTPREHRGKGYAMRGLGSIARALLAMNPSLSLYVNDFNHEAIALYERLGFEHIGNLATMLFP